MESGQHSSPEFPQSRVYICGTDAKGASTQGRCAPNADVKRNFRYDNPVVKLHLYAKEMWSIS